MKLMIAAVLLAFMLAGEPTHAQNLVWQAGGPVCATNPGPITIDSLGRLWGCASSCYGGNALQRCDSAGNWNGPAFGYGGGTYGLAADNQLGFFLLLYPDSLLRLSPNLAGLWSIPVEAPRAICVLEDDSPVVACNAQQDVQIRRYSPSGQVLWTVNVASTHDEIVGGIASNAQGDIFVAGSTLGIVESGTQNNGGWDAWVAKISASDGSVEWMKQFGTSTNDQFLRVAADDVGGLFVSGTTLGVMGNANFGFQDVTLVSIDAAGATRWTVQSGSASYEAPEALAIDSSGGPLLAGWTYGAMGGPHAGRQDAWLMRVTKSGVVIHLSQVGTPELDNFNWIAADGAGSFYTNGYFNFTGGYMQNAYPTTQRYDEANFTTYCTAGTSVQGCIPSISATGVPSATRGQGFQPRVSNVPGQRQGAMFYGFYSQVTPWASGNPSFKCVASPVARTGTSLTGGSPGICNGSISLDFNAWLASHPNALGAPFVPGQTFRMQGWYRDPAAPGQTNLSNAMTFTLFD